MGSHSKQIVLLDEEGEVLGSRYLKSGECVETGKKCTFPNYLIEIGEAKKLNKDIQRGKSGFATSCNRPEVGKSVLNRSDDPQEFCDLQDGKSPCPTSSVRREVGISTFGRTDVSLRTC